MIGKSYSIQVETLECIVVSDGSFAYPHHTQIFFVYTSRESEIDEEKIKEIKLKW